MRTRLAILALAAGVSLGGCAYGGLGMGYGSGGYGPYGSYGYDPYYGGNGISYGIRYGNNGYGYSPYGYSPYGGYGMPYYGWNNGYYYPGTGYYVYDSDRRPRVWSDAEKAYWTERLQQSLNSRGITKVPNNSQMRAVWDDFRRQRTTSNDNVFVPSTSSQTVRSQSVSSNRASRVERQNQNRVERSERRAERSADRASSRSTRSSETRAERRARKD